MFLGFSTGGKEKRKNIVVISKKWAVDYAYRKLPLLSEKRELGLNESQKSSRSIIFLGRVRKKVTGYAKKVSVVDQTGKREEE